jgi:hypothetical protein
MARDLLSAIGIAKLCKTPGRYSDGDGLYLVVGESGAASWLVRMQKAG